MVDPPLRGNARHVALVCIELIQELAKRREADRADRANREDRAAKCTRKKNIFFALRILNNPDICFMLLCIGQVIMMSAK